MPDYDRAHADRADAPRPFALAPTLEERLVVAFDRAASAGHPASGIVRGLVRTFDVRPEYVRIVLLRAGRLSAVMHGDHAVCWASGPTASGAGTDRIGDRETRTAREAVLLQAAVDLLEARGVGRIDDLASVPQTDRLAAVLARLADATDPGRAHDAAA